MLFARLMLCTLLLGLVSLSTTAQAGALEQLLMPGDLTQAHAKYEADCSNCHTGFGQDSQRKLCMDCHKKIGQDITAGTGFHGLSKRARESECRDCHSDHLGREADIVGLMPALFDHTATDFALKGAHRTASCASCHLAGKAYREAQHGCVACHEADDVHQKGMGEACQDCHSQQQWKKAEFDHGKTDFPLHGEHQQVACAVCHPVQRYAKTPKDCIDCHRTQDSHGGLFGEKCATCHNEKSWKKASFDHARETDFALSGRHAAIDCHSCHTEKTRGRKLPLSCQSCHRQADIHQGRFGDQCGDCHKPQGWGRSGFDHAKDGGFSLLGKHQKVPCNSCHGAKQLKAKKTRTQRLCVDCHRGDDVHKGSQGDRCDNCHGAESWGRKVSFDHDLGRFPLVGMHAITACAECHLDQDYAAVPQDCVSCHRSADVHQSRLGEHCAACHNPNSWNRWVFDHDTQTEYPLQGRHQKVACENCHLEPTKGHRLVAVSQRCASCHAADDIHGGGFGSACERCHQPSGFLDLDIKR